MSHADGSDGAGHRGRQTKDFYRLSRAASIKDERNLVEFDRTFVADRTTASPDEVSYRVAFVFSAFRL
jgi:hypothetical protein